MTSKRFAPPRGEDVPWFLIKKGDWAYTSGLWWKVVEFFFPPVGDPLMRPIMVKLERHDLGCEVDIEGVQRWRFAPENHL